MKTFEDATVSPILFLGDSHGNKRFVLEAIQHAHMYGAAHIVQLGDFGIWDHVSAGVEFLEGVDDALEETGISLIFCDGNHENFDSLLIRPVSEDGFRYVTKNIVHAPRGHIWEMNGVTFMAMGGAHSIDGPGGIWLQNRGPVSAGVDMGSWWAQETITTVQAFEAGEAARRYREDVGEIDVLIAHDCPAGVPIPGIGGYPAGDRNRELLAHVCIAADPKYIFCGHYHRRHTGRFKDARVEILAADISSDEQALVISAESLRDWPKDS